MTLFFDNPLETRRTVTNILLYLLAIGKPPKPIFLWLLKYVKGYQETQRSYPILYFIAKSAYLSSNEILLLGVPK